MAESIIKIENMKKSFSGNEILKDINFEITKGEVVCLLGSSGAGKTTLLRCLNFLEEANEGKLTFLDKTYDLSTINKKEIANIRKNTSFVFQDFNLFVNKKVLENVTEGLIIARKYNKKDAIEIAKKMLDKVGMLDKIDAYPSRLSGGQKQRVAIARALATNPYIIYFDEPTSALDPKLTQEVLTVMKSLANEGMTMLVVTHELSFAKNVANRILLIEDGKIIDDTTADAFFSGYGSEKCKEYLNVI